MEVISRSSALSVAPLAGALGARVDGVDLRRVDDETMKILRAAFLKYCVLVYPGQERLTPEEHATFAAQWGELNYSPAQSHVSCVDGNRAVLLVDWHGEKPQTDSWHSDFSLDERPPMGSLLLARIVPVGGDTVFANQYLAYEALSDGMKRMLEGLSAVHSAHNFAKYMNQDAARMPKSTHPVVRTHPETGRKALYVNSGYTAHFDGMSEDESMPLLRWLWAHCTQPNFTFRHRWSVGDLLMWDNRCTQHFAIADYGSSPRTMHRVTILGDRPR